ncbi:hypothetical protein BLOT_013454 [Blomia tropicalis]|nr:hypothetical protein BLOT_013454 [Blomia tropicalis]
MTTQPSNESELQLYRVLQRANLLAYYDTFICQGGDDVQQLCEAGEEEFLEIMALVGMASKPLHVRRLQKVLQEWMTNPALFQSPSIPPFPSSSSSSTNGAPSSSICQSETTRSRIQRNVDQSNHQTSPNVQNSPTGIMATPFTGNTSTPSPGQFQNSNNMSEYSQPCSPISMNPVLLERQIKRLAEAAESLVKSIPVLDIKPLINGNNKKRISKDIENIMNMSEDDPRRMDAIRKYAAIYGRFDCKRKPEKPLTLHEVSVNEAAAQICSKIPVLLYRRDELFPLARQVVRDSGYQYSKGHSRSQSCSKLFDDHSSNDQTSSKRIRLDTSSPGQEAKVTFNDEERKRRQDRLEGLVDQLKSLGNKQEELKSQIQEANERQNFEEVTDLQNELEIIADHQMQLVNEKAELEKQQKRLEKTKDREKLDIEDTDSQFSLYSNESTPSLLQESHDSPPTENQSSINSELFNKPNSRSKKPSNGNGNSNSNDSLDFTNKQILNDALDEGLRVAKELGQVLDDNIDLRLFNKYTEALRSSGCFSNLVIPESPITPPISTTTVTAAAAVAAATATAATSPAPISIQTPQTNNHVQRSHREGSGRPRGRPPKVTERDLQNTFYEQILSQAQMQQQMLANYQTHLQVQAALALGDFNITNGANSFSTTGGSGTGHDQINHDKDLAADFTTALNDTKHYDSNTTDKDSELNMEKDEVTQSLNALISMANGANHESMKHELNNLPSSVEFKIA